MVLLTASRPFKSVLDSSNFKKTFSKKKNFSLTVFLKFGLSKILFDGLNA